MLNAIYLSLTPLFAADSIAKTGTDQLLGSLVSHPALANKVRKSCVRPTGTVLGKLRNSGGMVDRRVDVSDHTRASAWNETLDQGQG